MSERTHVEWEIHPSLLELFPRPPGMFLDIQFCAAPMTFPLPRLPTLPTVSMYPLGISGFVPSEEPEEPVARAETLPDDSEKMPSKEDIEKAMRSLAEHAGPVAKFKNMRCSYCGLPGHVRHLGCGCPETGVNCICEASAAVPSRNEFGLPY